MPQPQAKWFVALAQAYLALKEIKKAAEAMDKAADISQKPEHIYQAGILRLQLKEADKALARLLPLKELPHPQANWFVALSNARILKEEYGLAAQNMERKAASSLPVPAFISKITFFSSFGSLGNNNTFNSYGP